jgi:hypothetical protein
MGMDMESYMREMTAKKEDVIPEEESDNKSSPTNDESRSDLSLKDAVRQLQVMMTGLQGTIATLAKAVASLPSSSNAIEDGSQTETGDPGIGVNDNEPPTEGEDPAVEEGSNLDDLSTSSEDEPPVLPDGDDVETGASPDELKGRHKKFIDKYGQHIPEDGQTVETFTQEQLKNVPYDKWASESAPYLLMSNAFPRERVAGWKGIPA